MSFLDGILGNIPEPTYSQKPATQSKGSQPAAKPTSAKPAASASKPATSAKKPEAKAEKPATSAKPADDKPEIGAVSKEELRRAFEAKAAREKRENAAKQAEAPKRKDTGVSPVPEDLVIQIPVNLLRVMNHLSVTDVMVLIESMSRSSDIIKGAVQLAVEKMPDAVIEESGADLLEVALKDPETRKKLIAKVLSAAPLDVFDAITADEKLIDAMSDRVAETGFKEAADNSQLDAVARHIVSDEVVCDYVIKAIFADPSACQALQAALYG